MDQDPVRLVVKHTFLQLESTPSGSRRANRRRSDSNVIYGQDEEREEDAQADLDYSEKHPNSPMRISTGAASASRSSRSFAASRRSSLARDYGTEYGENLFDPAYTGSSASTIPYPMLPPGMPGMPSMGPPGGFLPMGSHMGLPDPMYMPGQEHLGLPPVHPWWPSSYGPEQMGWVPSPYGMPGSHHQQGSRGRRGTDSSGYSRGRGGGWNDDHQPSASASNGGAASEQRTLRDGTCRTVMLRNLPETYSRSMLASLLDQHGFKGQYDFVYMPMNFRTKFSFGYAFANFVGHEEAKRCHDEFHGFKSWDVPSQKVCDVGWSNMHQGLVAHIERYRNSPVMHESVPDEYKPAVFTGGTGERAIFPPPTKKLRVPRIRRPGADGGGEDEDDEADMQLCD